MATCSKPELSKKPAWQRAWNKGSEFCKANNQHLDVPRPWLGIVLCNALVCGWTCLRGGHLCGNCDITKDFGSAAAAWRRFFLSGGPDHDGPPVFFRKPRLRQALARKWETRWPKSGGATCAGSVEGLEGLAKLGFALERFSCSWEAKGEPWKSLFLARKTLA